VRQHLRNSAVLFGVAITGALTWAMTAGAVGAGASTRLRSGGVRDQLASTPHLASNGANSASLGLAGPNVMAAIVGLLAFFAMAFIVVTLIRRRTTVA
jgi:hypothetical protein